MVEVRYFQTADGMYAVAIGPKIIQVGLTLDEAEHIQHETLARLRAEQRRQDREVLRQAFGRMGDNRN